MKKIIFTLIFNFIFLTILAQQSFYYSINTTLPINKKVTKLYIAYEIAGTKFTDSLNFAKKQFTLNKLLKQPVNATIYTNNSNIKPLSVMLANNTIAVVSIKNSISINKSKLQTDFLYLTANDRIRPSYFPLYGELYAKNDTVGLKKLAIVFDSLKNDDIKKSISYFKRNKESLLSLFSFYRFTTFFADYAKVEKDFAQLPNWGKNSPDGKNIWTKIEGAKLTQLNTRAKNFLQLSSIGQKVSLNTFTGKYILLDFWASWCVPCRKEHPNLINMYELYKNKNFEIISVSLDSDKDNWLAAIASDKITWTQISDLKGQQNDIALKYGVQAIPTNFLINPKGIIIAKNLTGEELNKRLNILLNK